MPGNSIHSVYGMLCLVVQRQAYLVSLLLMPCSENACWGPLGPRHGAGLDNEYEMLDKNGSLVAVNMPGFLKREGLCSSQDLHRGGSTPS